MSQAQLTLMGDLIKPYILPTTRYQGSKLKIVEWIWGNIKDIEFESVLDAFGGTGVVGYFLKTKSKQVFYNDILKSDYYIGTTLIENDDTRLTGDEIDFLLHPHPDIDYPTFIQDTFSDIYYTDAENRWLIFSTSASVSFSFSSNNLIGSNTMGFSFNAF